MLSVGNENGVKSIIGKLVYYSTQSLPVGICHNQFCAPLDVSHSSFGSPECSWCPVGQPRSAYLHIPLWPSVTCHQEWGFRRWLSQLVNTPSHTHVEEVVHLG